MFVCQQKQKKKLSSFVKDHHPSAIKLSISASDQRQSGSELDWNLKNVRVKFLNFLHFCFQNALE